VIEGYAALKLPLAMVIIDYHTWSPAPYGTNKFWPECWPDPSAMVDHAASASVELMLSPYFNFIGRNATAFNAARTEGLLAVDSSGALAEGVDGTFMFDVFNARAGDAMMRSVVHVRPPTSPPLPLNTTHFRPFPFLVPQGQMCQHNSLCSPLLWHIPPPPPLPSTTTTFIIIFLCCIALLRLYYHHTFTAGQGELR
jgi:hypothetical protein